MACGDEGELQRHFHFATAHGQPLPNDSQLEELQLPRLVQPAPPGTHTAASPAYAPGPQVSFQVAAATGAASPSHIAHEAYERHWGMSLHAIQQIQKKTHQQLQVAEGGRPSMRQQPLQQPLWQNIDGSFAANTVTTVAAGTAVSTATRVARDPSAPLALPGNGTALAHSQEDAQAPAGLGDWDSDVLRWSEELVQDLARARGAHAHVVSDDRDLSFARGH